MRTLTIVSASGAALNQVIAVERSGTSIALTFDSRSGTERNTEYAVALDRVLEVFADSGASLMTATVESAKVLAEFPNPADRNIQTSQPKPTLLSAVDLDSLRKELTNHSNPGGTDGVRNPSSAGAWKRAAYVFEFGNSEAASSAIESLVSGDGEPAAATGSTEGAASRVLVNKYERSPDNRAACLAHHGDTCTVCDKRMADIYGPIADGVVHVHHVTPISKLGPAYVVDPTTDLVPVCPNCHTMLHHGRGTNPRSVADLRDLLVG